MTETRVRDYAEWSRWLQTSLPGDRAIYHEGPALFLNDRLVEIDNPLADPAFGAQQDGRVMLLQRRLSPAPGRFAYLAHRISAETAKTLSVAEGLRRVA